MSQRHVPDVLRAAGHVVHLQRDTYGTGTLDVDWLPHVGAQGWVLITKDQHIRKRPMELRALFSAKVRAFVLIAGELTGADQGEVFKKALASMVRHVWRKKPPFVAGVTAGGRTE